MDQQLMSNLLKLNKVVFPTILLFFIVLISCGESKTSKSNSSTYNGRVVIPEQTVHFLDADMEQISSVEVQISDDVMERSQGLMDVRELPENHGMLFIFDKEEPLSFWMANTPLPLDIMYVNADSVIVSIYHSTTPFSEKGLPSGDPAKYVVETNGGYAITYGIEEGYRIRF